MEAFTDSEEFYEETNNLEEKFFTVGLSRREFVQLMKNLSSLDRDASIRYYIAAQTIQPGD